MTAISAFFNRAISASPKRNTAVYLIVVVVALAISGCGEDEKTPAQQLAESAGVPTGSAGATAAGPGATSTGSTGSTGKAGGKDKSSEQPKKQKKPSNPSVQIPNSEKPQTKSDSTEPSRMAVTINLKNGKMAETTPTIVMAPTEVEVDLDVFVLDNRSYTLKVVKAEGRATEAPIFPKKGVYTYSIGEMLDGQVATVTLGKKTIEIRAGAEPGP